MSQKPKYRRICPFCGAEFTTQNARKRYCREGHQKAALNARYRARHTESANCKACGASFERSATSQRKQSYCTPECQYQSRAEEYRKRPDILAGVARAREVR